MADHPITSKKDVKRSKGQTQTKPDEMESFIAELKGTRKAFRTGNFMDEIKRVFGKKKHNSDHKAK